MPVDNERARALRRYNAVYLKTFGGDASHQQPNGGFAFGEPAVEYYFGATVDTYDRSDNPAYQRIRDANPTTHVILAADIPSSLRRELDVVSHASDALTLGGLGER